jgi:2-dehydro-3-deoxygluconokinase
MAGEQGPVVTVGEALGALQARDGRLEDAVRYEVHVAGAELNYAIGLSRLGVAAAWFGAVGDDPFGRRVLRTARAEGVDVRGVAVDPTRPTGLLLKGRSLPDGEREVFYRRRDSAATAYVAPPDLAEAARAARGVHATGISLMLGAGLADAVRTLFGAAVGAPWRSFDLNVRLRLAEPAAWRAVLDEMLGRIDVLFASASDLAAAALEGDALAARCAERGVTAILRGEGRDALVVLPSGERLTVPPGPAVPVVDPVGAGDAFAAAVTAWRLAGAAWGDAVRAGQLAGAMVVGLPGDFEGAPYREELEALVAGRHLSR